MDVEPEPLYMADCMVDDALDAQIRSLLTLCFTKPQDVVFRTRRYFREPYPHRWLARDARGAVVAHIGVHDKTLQAGAQDYRIAGIAEVCVHPAHRGKRLTRRMLDVIHPWLAERGFVYSVLFGDPGIYGTSGYVQVQNFECDLDQPDGSQRRQSVVVMVRPLSGTPWPASTVYLPGPAF